MTRTIWLASYPKSGNTWLWMLIANLSAKDDRSIDINHLPDRRGSAGARGPCDYLLLIDSDLLSHDEIDGLHPHVYADGALRTTNIIRLRPHHRGFHAATAAKTAEGIWRNL